MRSARLELAVAVTTTLCRDAQLAHELSHTSAIALGRLLTAVALVALTAKRKGSTSAQIVTRTTLKQLFADATHEGHVRGFARNRNLAFPLFAGERVDGRRSLSPAISPGDLYVIRSLERTGEYNQSATPIVTGEIDTDLEHFLMHSDQIATALACDTIVDGDGRVIAAAGVLVQALPGGDIDRLQEIRAAIADGALVHHLEKARSVERILAAVAPGAEILDSVPLRWKCRCSLERVLRSLELLSPTDLAEMIEESTPVSVDCDLCAKKYVVDPRQLRRIFEKIAKAKG